MMAWPPSVASLNDSLVETSASASFCDERSSAAASANDELAESPDCSVDDEVAADVSFAAPSSCPAQPARENASAAAAVNPATPR